MNNEKDISKHIGILCAMPEEMALHLIISEISKQKILVI